MATIGNIARDKKIKFGTKSKPKRELKDTFLGFTDIDNPYGADIENIPFASFKDILRKYKVNTIGALEFATNARKQQGEAYGVFAVFKKPDGTIYTAKLQDKKFRFGAAGDEIELED